MSADDVRSVLEDVDYPASKEALLDAAFRAGAGSDVLKALRALPVEDYGNVDEVVRSVDTAEATGQSPADKAVRARERAHPELAEHMRDRQAPRLDPNAEE
ncbi:MAG: DUF2795 domain-containing protein [Actinomycetota bacterium]|nr:DUF2795 domain-containing protein [Actinomycetota bacterium]